MNSITKSFINLNFTSSQKQKFYEILDEWERISDIGDDIVTNIKTESKLDTDKIVEYIWLNRDLVFQNNLRSLKVFESNYENLCYVHSLQGKQINFFFPNNPQPNIVGTAIPYEVFIKRLRNTFSFDTKTGKKIPIKISEKDAEKIFDKLKSWPSKKLNGLENGMLFSRYAIWVTWGKNVNNGKTRLHKDPFFFAKNPRQAYKICANLGLSSAQNKNTHILLKYSPIATSDLLYPTIADAALYPYFNASNPSDHHGKTKNYKPDDLKNEKLKIKLKPRPEAVHNSGKYTLEILEKPLKIAKP